MALWGSLNARRPAPGSLLERWLSSTAKHPEEFGCGVRVLAGAVPGETSTWAFRRSAVDRFDDPKTLALTHGRTELVLARPVIFPATTGEPPRRNGHVLFEAREVRTGADLLLSVAAGQLDRFDIAAL